MGEQLSPIKMAGLKDCFPSTELELLNSQQKSLHDSAFADHRHRAFSDRNA